MAKLIFGVLFGLAYASAWWGIAVQLYLGVPAGITYCVPILGSIVGSATIAIFTIDQIAANWNSK